MGSAALTETLCGSSLEQIVNGGADDNPITTGVDCKPTNFDTVTAGNVLDGGWLADDLHELLTCVSVLVQGADVS